METSVRGNTGRAKVEFVHLWTAVAMFCSEEVYVDVFIKKKKKSVLDWVVVWS